MGSQGKYLRPEVIRQVARLDLKAKFIVEGFIAGLHDSPYRGFSVEFSEHRKYTAGDDPKTIDWNVYGKCDKFYVKKFQAETNLTGYLVMDLSGSMGYTYGSPMTKFDYAICLAASLGYMMIHQQDAVGVVTFDQRIRASLPPRSKRTHLGNILALLANCKPAGETDAAGTLHRVAAMIRHRSLVIIFSDLLVESEPVIKALYHLSHRGHDVIVFHILDAAEIGFPFHGLARFEDGETHERLVVDPDSIRAAYREAIQGFIETYRKRCLQANIDYVPIDTSVAFDQALMSYLVSRRSRF